MSDPKQKPDRAGPWSLNCDIIEMGGEEDTRVRPRSEFLRELRERLEKQKQSQPPPLPADNGDKGGS